MAYRDVEMTWIWVGYQKTRYQSPTLLLEALKMEEIMQALLPVNPIRADAVDEKGCIEEGPLSFVKEL